MSPYFELSTEGLDIIRLTTNLKKLTAVLTLNMFRQFSLAIVSCELQSYLERLQK